MTRRSRTNIQAKKTNKAIIDRFSNIREAMLDIMSFEDINATILYRIDGTVIKAEMLQKMPAYLIHLLAWIKTVITKVSKELSTDIEKISYVKGSGEKQYLIIFYKVGNTGILATVIDAFSNTALLSIEIERLARVIQNQLKN
ncbi:MAG: hypothetical protein ACXAEU_19255 [Candidatus Hodarchaeales archaeon]|jgi:predicted regulator of Ras-like GTPase activity (Roadblock/LC7/MglB family)